VAVGEVVGVAGRIAVGRVDAVLVLAINDETPGVLLSGDHGYERCQREFVNAQGWIEVTQVVVSVLHSDGLGMEEEAAGAFAVVDVQGGGGSVVAEAGVNLGEATGDAGGE